jgi:hypothetical protein
MDPYLEAPDIWPDFHDRLAEQISSDLNRTLPAPYYARLVMRPEIGIIGDEQTRRIVPDVSVIRPRGPAAREHEAGVAMLERPRADLSASVRMRIPNEPLRHHFIEIRDASRGHALVTLIEIASPSNKRPGPDRHTYQAKQEEILQSETSLIELDLLRGGQPLVGGPAIVEAAGRLEPRPDYLVAVNRAWQRGPDLEYELFPIRLEDPLPCIPVPLRKGEPEVPLDLQYAFLQSYDRGPYARGAVDYGLPPDPPVGPERAEWMTGCLERWRKGSAARE